MVRQNLLVVFVSLAIYKPARLWYNPVSLFVIAAPLAAAGPGGAPVADNRVILDEEVRN